MISVSNFELSVGLLMGFVKNGEKIMWQPTYKQGTLGTERQSSVAIRDFIVKVARILAWVKAPLVSPLLSAVFCSFSLPTLFV